MDGGRRRSLLGPFGSRFRGGFQASMLPRTSVCPSNDRRTSQTNSTGGNQMIISGQSSSVVGNQTPAVHQNVDVDSSDVNASVRAILSLCRGFCQQMTKTEQKLIGLERKPDKVIDTLKEINDLVKKLKKEHQGFTL